MNRTDAEKWTTEYLKPVFGFALKKCKSVEDAEDLSQEIMAKVYVALLKRDDIEDVSKFIWTIAHNCLSNYYRDNKHSFTGVPIDEVENCLCDETPTAEALIVEREEISKLYSEIAYLSKLQRRIVIMYYYENKKITFKFNGKKYTAKTNVKGIAKVTIKSSVLKKLLYKFFKSFIISSLS